MSPNTREILTTAIAEFWGLPPDGTKQLKVLAEDDEVLAAMLSVRALLASLFRNQDVERKWMRNANPGLDTDCPLVVMLSGRGGALKVRDFVHYLSQPDFL